jgi:hypothetical protein
MPPSLSHQANANNENIIPQESALVALKGSVVPMGDGEDTVSKSGEAAAIAEAIKKAGMAGPASIALRIASPLSWLGGQMLWAVQPLLQGLHIGPGSRQRKQSGLEGLVPRLATFLEGEGNIAELITHLEAKPGVQGPKSKVDDGREFAFRSSTDDGRESARTSTDGDYAIRNTQYSHSPHPPKGGDDGPA